eukprot:gene27875-11987_t
MPPLYTWGATRGMTWGPGAWGATRGMTWGPGGLGSYKGYDLGPGGLGSYKGSYLGRGELTSVYLGTWAWGGDTVYDLGPGTTKKRVDPGDLGSWELQGGVMTWGPLGLGSYQGVMT